VKIKDRVIVITGAAGGVGAAAARRFAAEGAELVLTDVVEGPLLHISAEIGAAAHAGDIASESTVRAVAALARARHGRIDIWFSNAGSAGASDPGGLQTNEVWQQLWDLHVMSHVYAARAVLPEMLERGEGYLLQTASLVALAMQVDRAHYTVTKHAALSFSEWLAANYRHRGIRVSCFCPGAMDTRMLRESGLPPDHAAFRRALSPERVAELLVRGIDAEKFLIGNQGPADAAGELTLKATDYEAWLEKMSALAPR
jgi:NAD(P)-dependent dehydrogenase (short-subunit alcohol dehydrogenase family)